MIKECKMCKNEYNTDSEFKAYCSSNCKSRDRFIEIPYKNKNFKIWKENFEKYPEFYKNILNPNDRFKNKCLSCGIEFIGFRKCCNNICSLKIKKETTFKSTGSYHNLSRDSKSRKNMENNLIEKYGIKNVFQRDDVKQKLKETWKLKYGFENPSISLIIKDKKRKTSEINKWWTPLDQWDERKIYMRNVFSLTKENLIKFGEIKFGTDFLERIKNSSKLGNKLKLTIDHRLSRNDGFINGIPVEVLSHICNLEIITFSANSSKNSKSSISLENLLNEIEIFDKQFNK